MASETDETQEENVELDVKSELTETQRALRETTLMIEQSQGEVSKLTQRNAAISSHLKQVQNQIGDASLEEVRMAYDSALDALQRLFVMRGQLEKLQSDKAHMDKYLALLKLLDGSGSSSSGGTNQAANKGPMATVEMLVNAQESERQRLSRQMHDGPAQALSNFILQTEIAMRLLEVDPAQARDELGNLKGAAMGTFQKVRNFIFELRPMMLDDLGLLPTIKRYADAVKEQSGIDVSVTISGNERRLEPYLEVMVFRAVQELMGNVIRHSQGNQLKINLDLADDLIRVQVDDNGKGFDPDSVQEGKSLGLKLIRERVEMLGGSFEIDSAVGKGTRIIFSLPLREQ
jgi:two-component system sensor histidine kinase DegS